MDSNDVSVTETSGDDDNETTSLSAALLKNAELQNIQLDAIGRSKTFKVRSCARPWFRAFHVSWISFFLAFMGWFSLVPALTYIEEDETNGITDADIKTSNILSVVATVFTRLLMGPLCEKFGARRIQSCILAVGVVLVGLSAMIDNVTQLFIIRLFIGLIGGAFVPCQYWTSMMFASNVVGTANAFAGGWGNLGAGTANVFGGFMIRVLKNAGLARDVAWRVYMAIPATLMSLIILPMWFYSDDCPQGHWDDRLYNKVESSTEKKKELYQQKSFQRSFVDNAMHYGNGFHDWRVWVLATQYGCCFGIELAINNSMTNYLYKYFLEDGCIGSFDECSILGKDTASVIAGLFGLMNLFARALGGLCSDWMNTKLGMRGRMIVQFVTLFMEGCILIIFSRVTELGAAIPLLILFSIFVQSAEGATFSLTPFVRPKQIANISAIVGAGGNVGAICWATLIKKEDSQADAYLYMGYAVAASAFLILFFPIQDAWVLKPGSGNAIANAHTPSKVRKAAAVVGEDDNDVSLNIA